MFAYLTHRSLSQSHCLSVVMPSLSLCRVERHSLVIELWICGQRQMATFYLASEKIYYDLRINKNFKLTGNAALLIPVFEQVGSTIRTTAGPDAKRRKTQNPTLIFDPRSEHHSNIDTDKQTNQLKKKEIRNKIFRCTLKEQECCPELW